MEFTFDAYKTLIKTSLEKGYNISSYSNVDNHERTIILRHDIDFSPQKALEIAEIEHEIGVKSTYFVLLSTEFYNVFSKKTTEIFTGIIDMGHQIGLHFDEQKYNVKSIDQLKEIVSLEAQILEKALDTSIGVVSMHRPSKIILDSNIEFEGLINSYSEKYFKDMKYVSDSRMYWREDVMNIISCRTHDKIHILTHPFWYAHKPEDTRKKLLHFINDVKIDRYDSMNNNFRNLIEYIKREEILK